MKKISILALAAMLSLAACKKEEENNNTNNGPKTEGIQGKWQSSGTDVAPLLVNLFQIDSIYAEFNTNMTYSVRQWDASGADLGTLSGTYTQSKSSTGNIWNITVEQTSPSALRSEGIFEIETGVMRYEIVQTEPSLGVAPPTAEGGFGSTGGGAFGTSNIQVYKEVK